MDIYIDEKAKEYIETESEDKSVQVTVMKVGGG